MTLTGGTLGDVTITGATGNGTALSSLSLTGNDISLGNIGGLAAGVSGASSVTAGRRRRTGCRLDHADGDHLTSRTS
ncbi:MAG: hypothetical protein IPP68_12445 [Elusimicrobia bacterium]|nr:hypothetical protein [Elusimicrobiota bacterium]